MCKKILRTRIIFSFSLLLTTLFSYAKEPGTVGGQALKLGASSRAMGQGEAFVAVSDDVSAIYWNPAGLTQLESSEIALTHMNEIVDVKSFDIAYAIPLYGYKIGEEQNYRVIGVAMHYLYTDDSARDDEGNELGRFMNYNTYLIFGYAEEIVDNLSFGLNAKFIYNKIYDCKTSNSAFDIATIYSPTEKLKFGLNVQNIETGIQVKTDETETLPLNFKTGISWQVLDPYLKVAFDTNKAIDSKPNFNFGGEYLILPEFTKNTVIENIAIRIGYKYKPENHTLGGFCGASCGLGIKCEKYQFDYAYTPYGDLGNNCHRFSFLVRF